MDTNTRLEDLTLLQRLRRLDIDDETHQVMLS
jgi:hypothetical protein